MKFPEIFKVFPQTPNIEMQFWKRVRRFKLWKTWFDIRRWKKYSALRKGILSRKKLTWGSWLRSDKFLLFKNGIKLIDLKFGSGFVLIQLNLNVAFSKWCQFFCQIPSVHNSNSYHNVLLSTTICTAPSFLYWNLHW